MTTSGDAAAPMRGLLDTSFFIAIESGRPIDQRALPTMGAVSVITIAELRAGVIGAIDAEQTSRRLDTYTTALELDPIPIDVDVANAWGDLRMKLYRDGRRMKANDSWIAATALAHGIPVVTQDGDFADGLGFDVIRL